MCLSLSPPSLIGCDYYVWTCTWICLLCHFRNRFSSSAVRRRACTIYRQVIAVVTTSGANKINVKWAINRLVYCFREWELSEWLLARHGNQLRCQSNRFSLKKHFKLVELIKYVSIQFNSLLDFYSYIEILKPASSRRLSQYKYKKDTKG